MIRLTAFLLGLATMVALILYGGLVTSYLWLWFVVPLGVRPIGVVEAIGLGIFVASFTYRFATKDDSDGVVDALVSAAVVETFLLGLGYFVHLFA